MSVTSEQLLESIHRLPDDQLQEFTAQVLRVNASRRWPSLSASETDLLKEINQPLPADQIARYRELAGRRDAGTLTTEEHRALCDLSDWLEERNAERLGHVAELARMRGVGLSEMMDQLGLKHLAD